MVQQMQTVCGECSGKRERINPKLRCKTCLGKKTVDDHKILEVHVDKGGCGLFIKIDKKWIQASSPRTKPSPFT